MDLELKNAYGRTALLIASRFGHVTLVDALLQAGANLYLQDHYGNGVLHLAALGGHVQVGHCVVSQSV